MNRRDFIAATTGALVAVPIIAVSEDKYKAEGPEVIIQEYLRRMPIGGTITINKSGPNTYWIYGDIGERLK